MPKLGLNRQQLKSFLPDHQAIVAFEKMLGDVSIAMPSTIEEASAAAATAIAAANEALSALVEVSAALSRLLAAPAAPDLLEPEDTAPRIQIGTLGAQNSDTIDVTGGMIGLDAGTVAAPSFYLVDSATGLYRPSANTWGMSIAGVNLITYSSTGAVFTQSVTTTRQLISTVATGTAPLVVASTTNVPNLSASSLNGATFAAPGAIGGGTRGAASFTTIDGTGLMTITGAASNIASFRNTGAAIGQVIIGNTAGDLIARALADGNSIIYSDTGKYLDIGSNGATGRMRVHSSGNVTIGTTIDGMTALGSLAVAKDLAHRGTKVGLFSVAPATIQTITGSRGGNDALASLLTAGTLNGYWIDSTTA